MRCSDGKDYRESFHWRRRIGADVKPVVRLTDIAARDPDPMVRYGSLSELP